MINEKTIAIIVFTLVRDPYVVNLTVVININASVDRSREVITWLGGMKKIKTETQKKKWITQYFSFYERPLFRFRDAWFAGNMFFVCLRSLPQSGIIERQDKMLSRAKLNTKAFVQSQLRNIWAQACLLNGWTPSHEFVDVYWCQFCCCYKTRQALSRRYSRPEPGRSS